MKNLSLSRIQVWVGVVSLAFGITLALPELANAGCCVSVTYKGKCTVVGKTLVCGDSKPSSAKTKCNASDSELGCPSTTSDSCKNVGCKKGTKCNGSMKFYVGKACNELPRCKTKSIEEEALLSHIVSIPEAEESLPEATESASCPLDDVSESLLE
jgi:hypothetical protein